MTHDSEQPSAGARELLIVFAVLAIIEIALVVGTRRIELFDHPLWLDETFTARLTNDASFARMIRAITNGFDTNPPTLYLLYWPIASIAGGFTDAALRGLSLAWTILGLTGLYAICRRSSFSREASFIATLAIAAHPLIVDQAFEARYYAPWFALTVSFAYLQLIAADREPATRTFARFVLGILATCIHYFGAISISLMAVVDWIVHRRVKRILPAAAGLLALATCVPLIRGQREALSVPTWIDRLTAAELRDQLIAVFAAPSFIFIVLLAWVARLIRENTSSTDHRTNRLRELLPFSALLLMPIALAVFSVVVQPSMMLRYSILAIAPLAPWLAAQVERIGRRAMLAAMFGTLALGGASIVSKSHATRASDADLRATLDAIDVAPPDATIVFFRRREMYPAMHARPELLNRCVQFDFDDMPTTHAAVLTRYERDMGRKAQRVYPELRMIGIDVLRRNEMFYIIAMPQDVDELARLLPAGSAVSDRDLKLHRVTMTPASTTGR